uniref:Uncharacterized protein n=1 Tax=Vespula pensylvanica TaxID=30213 RepID=A0A834P7Y5_VESPE|nr:hypothetical protein H0235_004816 [Vespula pensylvanica]
MRSPEFLADNESSRNFWRRDRRKSVVFFVKRTWPGNANKTTIVGIRKDKDKDKDIKSSKKWQSPSNDKRAAFAWPSKDKTKRESLKTAVEWSHESTHLVSSQAVSRN